MVEVITLVQQLLVGALVDILPFVDHDNIIHIADVTETVSDDRACPTLHQVVIFASSTPFYYYNFSALSKHTNNIIFTIYQLRIVRRIEHGKTILCRS
jgi:hypothetical protein